MKNNIALFFTGFGIGVFLGLSKSPILLQILVPILTIVVGLLAILTGQENGSGYDKKDTSFSKMKNINAFPIMWMILGMVSGSVPGMLARNYNILSPNEIVNTEPKSAEKKTEKLRESPETGLYGDESDFCAKLSLCNKEYAELICALKDIPNQEIEQILNDKNATFESIKIKINKLCNCKK